MKTITTISDMRPIVASFHRTGKTIGFVPTMGFLHEGHLSLMRQARRDNDIVVASIFVNPTQFGPQEDLERYPRDIDGDRQKCESAGVDFLFVPAANEMYPEEPTVFVTVEGISDMFEGAVRPGHFRGVATVVAKLLNIVKPHKAYFGQKDFQQSAIIKRMVKGLNIDADVIVMPTVRESDGLAMSSRNVYLSAEERKKAAVLFRALKAGEDLIRSGVQEVNVVRRKMRDILLSEPGIVVDYAEAADPNTLNPLKTIQDKIVLLVAVRIGSTRLIDNLLIV